MRRHRSQLGLAAAAALLAGAAGSDEGAGTATAGAPSVADRTCELSRVTDRSQVSSLRCVACHDGSTDPGTVFSMGRGPSGQSMSHPVEVDYAEARRRQVDRYVPEPFIPPEVPLVAGKVACTSCHDPRATTPNHVADPSRLCYACHQM